jgi:hypothetical protein
MVRRLSAVMASLGVLAGFVAPCGTARADDLNCSFEISPPQLVQSPATGTNATATVRAKGCSGPAQPMASTVCLASDGNQGRCVEAYGWNQAQVFFDPPQSTARYTATGLGCVRFGDPAKSVCNPVGPVSTTLTRP